MKPSTPVRSVDRSFLEVKVLLTVASVAAVMGGWAWLSLAEERREPPEVHAAPSEMSAPAAGASPLPGVRFVRTVRRPRAVTVTRSSR